MYTLSIDPVAFHFGSLSVHWYGLAYVIGILLSWRYCRVLGELTPRQFKPKVIDDLLFWITIGIILGGRLGFVLFYDPIFYLNHPLEILKTWDGGMAFHGGLIGTALAIYIYCRKSNINPFSIGDIVASAAPLGLFFGRIANFINGELYGKPTGGDWGVIFPHAGLQPRHPTQLYEAFFEGILLFILLFFCNKSIKLRSKPGVIFGIFLITYGVMRTAIEFVRIPDAHIGYFYNFITMGQLLTLPMILIGGYLVARPRKNH